MDKETQRSIREDMRRYAEDILKSKNFRSSSKNIQHGDVSVMKHSMKVAYLSMWLNRKLHINCDEKALTRGALLHDYFLYDWHDKNRPGFKRLHGFHHPQTALKNAKAEYDLSDREQDIIKKHMWPLTVIPPKYRESWVVTCADKAVSTAESVKRHSRKYITLPEKDKDTEDWEK